MPRKKKQEKCHLDPIALAARVQEYREAREKMLELRKEYLDIGQEYFREEAKALFLKHPDLRSFGWVQYTPYFNDGDACHFCAHTDDPRVNGLDYYNDDLDDQDEDQPKLTEERRKVLRDEVSDFLNSYEQDDLEEWFGDHVEVMVTPEEVTTTEYSHD